MRRRGLGPGLILLSAYLAALGLRAGPGQALSGDEQAHLAAARGLMAGNAPERPRDLGLALVLGPLDALGGRRAVEIAGAALMALAFVLAAAVARRLVPEPWATRGALAVGVSPPVVLGATTVGPQALGAVLVASATVLALRVRDAPRLRHGLSAAALVAALAWVDLWALGVVAVLAVLVMRWLRRRHRGLAAFSAFEVVLLSGVVLVSVSDRLYGRLLPVPDGDDAGIADRLVHLGGALADPRAGALRWAPVLVLAGVGGWALWRGRRAGLARVVSDQVDREVIGGLLALIVLAGVVIGALGRPGLRGPWAVLPEVVIVAPAAAGLVGLGWRRAPRTGAALALLTVALSGWVLVTARIHAGAGVRPPAGLPAFRP